MWNTRPYISIIVPVYNAGFYLKKRIESLIYQTLQEIEIVIVLDCPNDGSDKVVNEYALSDNRIKVIQNKENQHIGLSRNIGLEMVTGEYVAFADHDDYCRLEMYGRLYRKAKQEQADIVFCDMYFEREGVLPVNKAYFKGQEERIREKTIEELLKGNGFYYSVLNHLYRVSFLKEHAIRFVDTRKVTLEDRYFNLLAYHYARKVVHIAEGYLYHVLYKGSTQHSYAFKSLLPMLNHLEIICDFFQEHPEYESIYRTDFGMDIVRKLYDSFLPEIRYKSVFYGFHMLSRIKEKSQILAVLKYLEKERQWRQFPFKLKCFYRMLRFFY